jgi:hypothetical protein
MVKAKFHSMEVSEMNQSKYSKPIISSWRQKKFTLEKLEVIVIPYQQFEEDIRKCSRLFGEETVYNVSLIEQQDDAPFLTAEIRADKSLEFLVSCDIHYPHSVPRILRIYQEQSAELELDWNENMPCHYGLFSAMSNCTKKNIAHELQIQRQEIYEKPKAESSINEVHPLEKESSNDPLGTTTVSGDVDPQAQCEEVPSVAQTPSNECVEHSIPTETIGQSQSFVQESKLDHEAGGNEHVKPS